MRRSLVILWAAVGAFGCGEKPPAEPAADVGETPTEPAVDVGETPTDTAPTVLPWGKFTAEPAPACLRDQPPGQFVEAALQLGIIFVQNEVPTIEFGPPGPLPVGGGVAATDLDGDGHIDLYFGNTGGKDEVYLTGGRGPLQYKRYPVPDLGETPRLGIYAADPDRDGDMDLLISPAAGGPGLLLNDGAGTFSVFGTPVSGAAGVAFEQSAAWTDINGDGQLDIVIAGGPATDTSVDPNAPEKGGAERLFRGLSATDYVSHAVPPANPEGQAFIAAPVDYDNDGDPDIYVVNDIGMDLQPNRLLRNDGGTLVDVSFESDADVAVWGMGLAVGDPNNDGWLDFYVTSMSPLDDVLLLNLQNGRFDNVTKEWSASSFAVEEGVSWGAIFIDTDSDGHEDLFVTHGFHHTLDDKTVEAELRQSNVLLMNTGDAMVDGTDASGLRGTASSRSPVEADLDGDGFPDLVVGNLGRLPYVYLNGCDQTTSWAGLRFVRRNGAADVVGLRVRLEANGRIHIREMGSGNDGLFGSGPNQTTIGLGDAQTIDTLIIRWPGGAEQTLTDLPVRHWITAYEP